MAGLEPSTGDDAQWQEWREWLPQYEAARAAIVGPEVLPGSLNGVRTSPKFKQLGDLEPILNLYLVVQSLVTDLYQAFEVSQATASPAQTVSILPIPPTVVSQSTLLPHETPAYTPEQEVEMWMAFRARTARSR